MKSEPQEITRLITEWQRGSRDAESRLFEALYSRLREIAANCLKTEPKFRTLGPTALVHEAYLRLMNAKEVQFTDRRHFVALVATVMRRIVVDRARARKADKRGGDRVQVDALDWVAATGQDADEILNLEAALVKLEAERPRQARVVELRHFVGLSIEETATALSIAERTVKHDWEKARLKLREAIDLEAGAAAAGHG
jgi:hypothetical protein